MIGQIEIENYKSISKLSFDLGQFNVFIGENGSGKSNILEAIALHTAASDDKLSDEFLANRGIRLTKKELMKGGFSDNNQEPIKVNIKNRDNEDNIIKMDFDEDGNWLKPIFDKNPLLLDYKTTQVEIEKINILEFQVENLNKIISDLTNQKSKILEAEFSKTAAIYDSLNIDLVNANKIKVFVKGELDLTKERLNKLTKIVEFYKDLDIRPYLTYAPDYITLRNSFEKKGHIQPFGVNGEGLLPHLLDLVEKNDTNSLEAIKENLNFISWFEGIDINRENSFNTPVFKIQDKYLEDGIKYFNIESANEGFLYLLFYFTLFISPKAPHFFAIENIDNALNPKLCREMIKILIVLAKKYNKQVIVTAHNPAILDGLDLKDDEQRLYAISRNLDGYTRATRIKEKPQAEGTTNMRLSEMFMNGIIGGLPQNF